MAGNSLIGKGGYLLETLAMGYKDLRLNEEAGPLELVSFI